MITTNYYKMNIKQQYLYRLSLALLLSVVINILGVQSATDVKVYECTDSKDFVRLDDPTGIIKLTKNVKECRFKTKDNTSLLAIRTDNLALEKNETIQFSSNGETPTFSAPFHNGWIINGFKEPELIFNMVNLDKSIMFIEYIQDSSIPFDVDVIDYATLKPSNIEKVDLLVKKTINNTIHLDIDSEHTLIKENQQTIPITFNKDNNIIIKSSIALETCSGTFDDKFDTTHDISGPDVTNGPQAYECVNIFKTENSGHYDVDFKDFLGLVDDADQLVIGNTLIKNPQDENYKKKLISYEGNKLTIIYKSPKRIAPKKFQFKLTVVAREFGGILENQGDLKFANKDQIHFVLRPTIGQYASIQMPANFKLQDVNLKLTSNSKVVEFGQNIKLPQILALDEQDTDMILDFSGKGLDKLDKKIVFKSLQSHCHKIIQEPGDVVSFSGPITEPCYWMMASSNNFDLKFDHNDLNPNGCIEIVSQEEDKPIYSKCGLSQNDVLPTFILKQAYINVKLQSKDTRVIASFSSSASKSQITLNPEEKDITIVSQGYPVSYPWSAEKQSYTLSGVNKNYLFSIYDVDIRAGEKLNLDSEEINKNDLITGDIIRSNVNTTITLSRSSKTSDFNQHRGFKLTAKQFTEVYSANITKNQLITSGNSNDLLIKISAPGTKKDSFGMRLSYNITIKNVDKNSVLSIYDGRTILKHQIVSPSLVGESTSDTLLFVYKNEKAKLPIATVNYQTIACNTTNDDHVCDMFTRCVPKNLICQNPRQFYCDDGSDVKIQCNGNKPIPPPKIIETGLSGIAVFILCMLMLAFGAVGAIYGPDLYKNLENRFRSGQYSTFNSVE